jgi:hypothetical protein
MAGASVGLLVAHPARTEGVAEKTERELNRFKNKTLPKVAEKTERELNRFKNTTLPKAAETTEKELKRFKNTTLPWTAEKISTTIREVYDDMSPGAFITKILAMVCGTAIIVAYIRSRSSLGGVPKVTKRAVKKFKKNKKNKKKKSTTTRT